jgi:hypothetical protein
MAALTTEDLCKILHYALEREERLHGHTDLDLETGTTWDEAPRDYKMVMLGAMSSVELVTRKDEREAYRRELTECLDDLMRNPRATDT